MSDTELIDKLADRVLKLAQQVETLQSGVLVMMSFIANLQQATIDHDRQIKRLYDHFE